METKMYMYRIGTMNDIQKYEVTRVTEKSVFYKAKKGRVLREEAKKGRVLSERTVSDYHRWYSTLEEAVTNLLNYNKAKIDLCRHKLSVFEKDREEIIQKYKVQVQTINANNGLDSDLESVKLGKVELEVYNQ